MADIQKKILLRILKRTQRPAKAAGIAWAFFVSVLMALNIVRAQAPEPFDRDALNSALERVDELRKAMVIPDNRHRQEGAAEAEKVYRIFGSEEFQKRVRTEMDRLKKEVFGLTEETPGPPYYAGFASRNIRRLRSDERIYLFISSSIPKNTLRSYARDMDLLGDPNIRMVLRGFVGGMNRFRPTLDFLEGVLLKNGECLKEAGGCESYRAHVQIDPMVFRKYGVSRVPVIAYVRSLNLQDPELSEGHGRNAQAGEFCLVHGDASLGYALEVFRRETGSRSIEALIEALKTGIYRN